MSHISHPLDHEAPNMSARLRNLVQAPRPDIKITIQNPKKVWTTMDEIKGLVSITCPADTRFDTIDIQLVGTTRTYVERVSTAAAVAGRADAFHQFLKLVQPNLEQSYPADRVFLAGKTYNLDFVFNVPNQLLPRVCQHKVTTPAVKQAHLSLPPTFGDKNSDDRQGSQNDLAPDMASVRYGIFARIWKSKTNGNEVSRVSLACKARRLRVLPASEEQAPLAVHEENADYSMRKTKTLRKGMLKGKSGTLTMEAVQPPPIRISVSNDSPQAASSVATISLRFDPSDESSSPPRLSSLSSRLKVITMFASCARQDFPIKTNSFFDSSQGAHSVYVHLANRCISNVDWIKQRPTPSDAANVRRDSACSIDPREQLSAVSGRKSQSFYTAQIVVPLSLPTSKHSWVPTFHTCLVTRQYALKLDLGINGTLGSFLELKVPIQITCDGRPENDSDVLFPSGASSDGQDVDDADDFFEPRVLRAPSEGFIGRSRIGSQVSTGDDDAPPGYTPYAGAFRSGRRAASVPL